MAINTCRVRRLLSSGQRQVSSLSCMNAAVRTRSDIRSFAQTIRTASAKKAIPPQPKLSRVPTPQTVTRGRPAPKIQEYRDNQFSPRRHDPLTLNPRYFPLRSETEPTLLYASPNHGSFNALSYSMGLILILGAVSWAQVTVQDPDSETAPPWYMQGIAAVPTLCMAGFGTTFLLAPSKVIRSISLMAPKVGADGAVAKGPRTLLFEVKRGLPFMKPSKLEFETTAVFLNRILPTLQDINFRSVPLSEAQSFTSKFLAGTLNPEPKRSILEQISAINRSMVNVVPALSRDVRRMFLKDQMVSITVTGKGAFKMDLQGCYLLDGGRALEAVTTPAETASLGMMGRFWNILRG